MKLTVLLDSWAWIEYFKGTSFGKKAQEYIENKQEIITSAINISEVQGFLLRTKPGKEAQEFIQFMVEVSFVIPVNMPIALKAAKLKYDLKFGLADAIVLATAREHDAIVVTGDDDFKGQKDVDYIGS